MYLICIDPPALLSEDGLLCSEVSDFLFLVECCTFRLAAPTPTCVLLSAVPSDSLLRLRPVSCSVLYLQTRCSDSDLRPVEYRSVERRVGHECRSRGSPYH